MAVMKPLEIPRSWTTPLWPPNHYYTIPVFGPLVGPFIELFRPGRYTRSYRELEQIIDNQLLSREAGIEWPTRPLQKSIVNDLVDAITEAKAIEVESLVLHPSDPLALLFFGGEGLIPVIFAQKLSTSFQVDIRANDLTELVHAKNGGWLENSVTLRTAIESTGALVEAHLNNAKRRS